MRYAAENAGPIRLKGGAELSLQFTVDDMNQFVAVPSDSLNNGPFYISGFGVTLNHNRRGKIDYDRRR